MATRVRQGQIRGGEPQYADLLEEIAALKAAINSLSVDAGNIVADINALDGRVTINEGEVVSLHQRVDDVLIDIGTINGDISNIYLEIAALPTQAEIDLIESDIGDLQQWLSDLEIDLTSTQGDLLTLAGDVSLLETNLNDLFLDVDTIELTLVSIQNYLDVTLESRLQALESLLVEQGFEIVYNDFGLIEKLVFDDTSETVLIYDLQGNISQVVTPTSTKTLVYDGLGRLIGVDVS